MRSHLLDLRSRILRAPTRRFDIIALCIVLAYAAIAASAQLGASVGGQGLDPVWAAAQQRGALRVATDYGFMPFSGTEAGQPVGYDVELATAVAAKMGLRVEFVGSSLDSIYEDLARGKADMGASALPYAPEQGWRVTFSSFYFNAGQVLVVPEGSSVATQDDLSGLTLGAPLGSDADTYARKLVIANPRITLRSQYDTADEALDDVRRGTLDAAIVDNTSALISIARAPGLKAVSALTLEPYVLAFPAQAYQLHDNANKALDELRREGFFEELGRKWFR